MAKHPPRPLYAYTDGACCGNPGPGGWGVVLLACDHNGIETSSAELSGGESITTNNRMELMAAISALEILPDNTNVVIVTDSKYVQQGITLWVKSWKRNNWQVGKKREIKNLDLWMRLHDAEVRHSVKWRWVKGHSGHSDNERADALAKSAMEIFKKAEEKKDEAEKRKMGY